MDNQSKTNLSGKKCNKKLSCKHVCQKEAATKHTCACSLKWILDPGCGHTVSGNCSQSPSAALSQECLVRCGQILRCGHPCKETCGSACACSECDSKNSTDSMNLYLDENVTANSGEPVTSVKDSSDPPAPAAASGQIGQIAGSGSGVKASGSNMAYKVMQSHSTPASSAQTSSRKPVMKLTSSPAQIPVCNIGINRTPVLKLTSPKPDFPPMGFGSFGFNFPLPAQPSKSTCRASAQQPSTSRPSVMQDPASYDLCGIEHKSLDQLPAHQLEQLKKLLPKSALDKNSAKPYDELFEFTQCINEHLFTLDKEYCPICGCPPYGPDIALFKQGVSAASAIPTEELNEMVLNDDNAWKLGFAKCSNDHYFYAGLPRCDICGEVSMFYMGNEDGD